MRVIEASGGCGSGIRTMSTIVIGLNGNIVEADKVVTGAVVDVGIPSGIPEVRRSTETAGSVESVGVGSVVSTVIEGQGPMTGM